MLFGVNGAGGEIGHICVDENETEICGCGNTGCLEQYTSATGVVRLATRAMASSDKKSALRDLETVTAKDVFDLAKIGDELAKAYENGDADAMIELMKDDYYELYNETWGDNFVEEQFNEDVQDMKEEVGTVKSIKIEDRSEEKYEKDEIEDVNKTLDRLNVDMKVDDCLEIDMDVEIKGSEDDADGKITYTVVKSGSKWYLVDYDLYVY